MAGVVAMLQERGRVEVHLNEERQETYRLTDERVQVGHMLAMVEGEDAQAVLEALPNLSPYYALGLIMSGAETGTSRAHRCRRAA